MPDVNIVGLHPDSWIDMAFNLDGEVAKINTARFVEFDYNGKRPDLDNITTLCLNLTKLDPESLEDLGEDALDHHWKIGDIKDWMPWNEGKALNNVGSKVGLWKGCKGIWLLKSLVDAGFSDEALNGNDISVLDGLIVSFKDVPYTSVKRIDTGDDGQARPNTVSVVDKIIRKAEDKANSGGVKLKGAGKKKPVTKSTVATKETPSKAAESDTDVETKAVETVMELVMGKEDNSITKVELISKAFMALKGQPDMQKVSKMLCNDEFLKSENRPWKFENGIVSLG